MTTSEDTFAVDPDPYTFYVCNITPEHSPWSTQTLAILCEHHYLQAASCLMIRRVLAVRSQELDLDGVTDTVTCKFCS